MLKEYDDWSKLIQEVVDNSDSTDQLIKYVWPGNLTFGIENLTKHTIYSIGLSRFKRQANTFKTPLAAMTWLDIYKNSVPTSDYELFVINYIKSKKGV